MKHTLDTDVLIDILRGYSPAVEWFSTLPEQPSVVSLVVMELVQGCRNKEELRVVQQLTMPLEIWYPSELEMQQAMQIFMQQYLRTRLSIIDAIVGTVAASRSATLCTFNTHHYRAIPDLQTAQPYPKSREV